MVMGVVPEETGRMVFREVVLVVERLAVLDVNKDVIAIALRGDVHAMDMEIGKVPAEVVNELDLQAITGTQAKDWPR
jgi:hypothetical protein